MFLINCPHIVEQNYSELFSTDILLLVGVSTETAFLKIYTEICWNVIVIISQTGF